MILVGNQRGGGKDLARHLMKDENEHVVVHEVRGFAAADLDGAFQESYAMSRATNCKQHLYSLSLNPPKEASVSVGDFEDAVGRAEADLGLTGQPRAIIFHEKIGTDGELRRHAHAVWCRINADEMKAVQMSFDKRKLNEVSRDLYLQHGWTMPRGFVKSEMRDPSTYSLAEWQQAKRTGNDPKELKTMFQDCWAISDSKQAFSAALRERGFVLAQGDRRGYVAVDHSGEVHAIAKWTGQKTKAVRDRLGTQSELPSIKQAHEQAAKILTNRLHDLRKEEQRIAAHGRQQSRDIKAKQEARQHQERVEIELLHKLRRERESRERVSRVRTGFWGLVDRISGRRRKIAAENREAELRAEARDDQEQRELHKRQEAEQQRATFKFHEFRARRTANLKELRDDQRSLTQEAKTRHPEPDKSFRT